MKLTKSIILRNVTNPADSPYLYKKSKMYGITNVYEKMHPEMNNPIAGIVIVRPTLISASFSAGFKNETNSFMINGTLATIPISAAM